MDNNTKLFDYKLKRSIIRELDIDPYNYCEICIINNRECKCDKELPCECDEFLCERCTTRENLSQRTNENNINNEIYEKILLRLFEVGGIELFKKFSNKIFVKNINEKLLSNYLRGEYRKECCHSTSPHIFDENLNCIQTSGIYNKCNFPNCECNIIQDIIDLGVDLHYVDGCGTFISKANFYDITILIKNGADINQIYNGDNTAIADICYGILIDYDQVSRFDFLLKNGADLNIGNLWKQISGVQYIDRPKRIEFIKHLIDSGMNCDNMQITKSKKLYDTRVGLIVVKYLYGKLFEEDGSCVMLDNSDAYRVLLNNMDNEM